MKCIECGSSGMHGNQCSQYKSKRIHPERKNGLFNREAPFWKGERAEDIVRERVEGYKKKKTRTKK